MAEKADWARAVMRYEVKLRALIDIKSLIEADTTDTDCFIPLYVKYLIEDTEFKLRFLRTFPDKS